ncbi:MAG TPA: alanine racemase [Longimicrobiales bacterium]|nr:alanine racemase [Longimicrobiales bacterium]
MSEEGRGLGDLETPFLWVDLDAMDANVQVLTGFLRDAGVAWRPHIKGVRAPGAALRLLDAGAIGVTCATVGEAEIMADAGVRDLLVANQVVGERKQARVAALSRRTDVKVAVDSEETLSGLARAALAADTEVAVLIEVDVGMHRAGIEPGGPALALARRVRDLPGLRLAGVMGWEGHTAWMDDPDRKREEIERSMRSLVETAELLRESGCPAGIVSCGGSCTYAVAARVPGVTEVQAGGGVFSDVTYLRHGHGTRPALFVRATVTSRPAPDRIIVDAGFKTLPTWVHAPRALGVEGVREIGISAEHGIVRLDAPDASVRVGDTLDFVPGYGDVTVFLHDRLYAVRGGRVEHVWPIEGRAKVR